MRKEAFKRKLDRELPGANGKVSLDWQRGFVQKVECRLECWERHGLVLVRRHPIRRVVIPGKLPMFTDGSLKACWMVCETPRFVEEFGTAPYAIPDRYKLAGEVVKATSCSFIWYEDGHEAMKDLSRACLEHARAQPAF